MRISAALVRIRSIFYFSISILFIFLSPLAVSVSSASPLVMDALSVEYDITVHIDPVAQTIEGRNVITTRSTDELILALNSRFKVTNILVDGVIFKTESMDHGALQTWRIPNSQRAPKRIEVSWKGKLLPLNTSLNHRQTLGRGKPVSGSFGTFLPDSSGWYPHIRGELASYRVSLKMPQGQRGIVAGKIVEESDSDEG